MEPLEQTGFPFPGQIDISLRGPVKYQSCRIGYPLRWRHNDHAGVSNHQPPGCLLNRLFRRKSKKTSKLRVTGLCAGNSPGTGEFSAQMASYAENVSIWWRHHAKLHCLQSDFWNVSRQHCDWTTLNPYSPASRFRNNSKMVVMVASVTQT